MAETTTRNNLVEDLCLVQGSLPSIKKDAKGNFGKYVTLDAIHEAVLPLLAKHNLAWITKPGEDEAGNPILDYELRHRSGETITGRMRLMVSQANMQQFGSAITYAKRYSICAVVGVTADEDDDGTAAKAAPYKKPEPKPEVHYEEPVYNPDEVFNKDEAQEEVSHVKLSPEHVAELLDMAKKLKGAKTKPEAVTAINKAAGTNNFLELSDRMFTDVKAKLLFSKSDTLEEPF